MTCTFIRRRLRTLQCGVLSFGLSLSFVAIGLAANVAWGPATNIAADTDVVTVGTLLAAVNTGTQPGGGPAPSTTVNGVTFTGWGPGGFGPQTDPSGHFTFTAAAGFGTFGASGFGSASPPFSALSADYRTLLDYANFAANAGQSIFNGDLTLTISGLTVNHQYTFQWWTNDSRPFSTGPITATTGPTSVSLDPNTSNAAGGAGQFAVGNFTADATTQAIVFSTTGNGNLQNAFQIRDLGVIPEPATAASALVMLAVLVCRLRRY